MPRQFQPVEFNTFIGGLVTEASPLTFPNNASLDEENFVLNKDGSRSRRLGMQYEVGGSIVTSAQTLNPQGQLVAGSFKWSNAGGLSTNTVICVQIGSSIDFFQGNATAISSSKFYTYTFSNMPNPNRFSYASVDGKLIVATGNKEITIFSFDNNQVDITKAITVETKRLLIRDLFGLDCLYSDGRNLREGSDISFRPAFSQVGPPHIYNLRNQGWAIPHSQWNGNDYVADTIIQFCNNSKTVYPSNADNITSYLYANTNDSGGTKTITRFDAENLVVNAPVNTYSPIGYFIIDALDRNASRRAVINDMQNKFPQNDANLYQQALRALTTDDSTPTGATVVCEFAGRIFYAGFSGEVIGGDQHSPKMSSYILFSQLVRDSSGVNRCYQAADPTDPSSSDLVDTDGGFLRIEGAYGIIGMAVLQSTLFVFAHNGVWAISGGSGAGFTATNYNSAKLTSSGCISTGSIVPMQDSIFYWGLDGIYAITRNQFGDFKSENITNKTIKRFYMSIPDTSIRNAEGIYNSYDNAVKWVYNNYIGATDNPIELNLDVVTGAYYRHRIKPMTGGFPLLIRGIQTDPYRISTAQNNVVVGVDNVLTADNSQVIVNYSSMTQGVKEVIYFILTGTTGGTQYTFGNYNQAYHYDWVDIDGIGIDTPAYLLTGVLSGGDYQRSKQIVYQTTHFARTEIEPIEFDLSSRPYPYMGVESLTTSLNNQIGDMHKTYELISLQEGATTTLENKSGILRAPLVSYNIPPEAVSVSLVSQSAVLRSIFRSYNIPNENVTVTLAPVSGSMKVTLIQYNNYPAEAVQVSLSSISGSLT